MFLFVTGAFQKSNILISFMFVYKVILNISKQMCKAVLGSHSYPLSYGIRIIEAYKIILHAKVCNFPFFFHFQKIFI